MKDIIVIGAGAAGIMAALAAAEQGAAVQLFEKNNIVGKKMGITGKGRCNLTNACSMEDFIAHTPGHGKFLYSAYEQFSNQDLLEKLNGWGLATKVERGGRVFPQSDSAVEVRKFLYRKLCDAGVRIHFEDAVKHVSSWGDTVVVQAASGTYEGSSCIITTGGMSYPVTGSTGDGYGFAKELGHTVTELKPSIIPFTTKETWPHHLSGLSLRNVEGSLWRHGKKLAAYFGEMLFTHFGVSGPIILMLSSDAAHNKKCVFPMQLRINLKPALSKEQLDERIQRDFQKYIRKEAENAMKDLLPQRLIPIVLEQAGIEGTCPVNQISKEQRRDLADTLQALALTVTGTRPIEEAIVTAGGVSVKEVSPKTMESKVVPHIYFAGEVLDIDAFTGGYNLQAAFSTGYAAGTAAAGKECGI
jgi:predicted Rossmann fold flavoprotein